MTKILLREIIKCTHEQKQALRKIRNQDGVRKYMYTDHIISLDEHLAWVQHLQRNNQQAVFIVLMDGVVGGVVSVNEIDRINLKSDWAFYLNASIWGGLGAALEFGLINFIFQTRGLEKLNCEVIKTNEAVVKLHKKFGSVEEGFRRENIIKNENRIGVFCLGLTKSDWVKKKEMVKKRYERVINKFDLEIEYEPT